MKTALVHHWLVTTRGGERTFEALAELFPAAEIFTLVCDPAALPESLRARRIQSSLLQHLPKATKWYPYYLPFFPLATQRMNLTQYDLVISSDAATVKGVHAAGATHICYCHTPMRYVWDGYEVYRQACGPIARRALEAVRPNLCRWDFEAAQHVTHFVANSRNVQKRIQECYKRESCVIYPPVDTERFTVAPGQSAGDSFLLVSQLVPYKRVDLLVDAFNQCKRRLTIIGDGPERRRLEQRAGSSIRFLGSQPDTAVVRAMRECKAFVFAGEEDFGIVMAEAQACGKPVVALGKGGAAEIVQPDETGVLFSDASVESILDALERFDRTRFSSLVIRESALRFGRDRFQREFRELLSLVGCPP